VKPVAGHFSQQDRSSRLQAQLFAETSRLEVRSLEGETLAGPVPVTNTEISSRLGNTPRVIRFHGIGSFETRDNDWVDHMLQEGRFKSGFLYRLESSWRYVLIGLLITLAVVWGGVRYGVPAGAHALAFALPERVSRELGNGALMALDQGLLSPSTLSFPEQEKVKQQLMSFAHQVSPSLKVDVVFRDASKSIGPNALALPSGTIVFTDQLVHLAQNEQQLAAVMAHEMGHVDSRHALRRLIQSSALAVVAMAVLGDVSSVSSVIAAVPVILTELGYSRAFEYEADRYAASALDRAGVSVTHLTAILHRLEQSLCDKAVEPDCQDASSNQWKSYVSTHPGSVERAKALEDNGF
jgi:Zn-dependent protease with chaperone function